MKDISKYSILNISEKKLSELLINYKIENDNKLILNPNKIHIFFYNNKLYGKFKISYINNKYYYFIHKPYRSIKYFISKEYNYNIENYILNEENNTKLIYTFLDEIKKKQEILIKFINKEQYSFTLLSSKNTEELIYYYKQDNFSKINNILNKIQNIIITDSNTNSLKKYGYYLWNNLFNKQMKDIIKKSNIINYYSNYEINPDYIHTGKYYLNQKAVINLHNLTSNNVNKKNKNIAVVMPLYNRDKHMEAEAQITEYAVNKNKYFNITKFYSDLSKIDFENILKDYQIVHFIGHGIFNKKIQGIYLGKENLFTNADFKKINNYPDIFIVSSCRALKKNTITHILNSGSKYIIHSFFDIFSENNYLFYKSLYWNLLNRNIPLGKAIKNAKNKLYKKGTNNFNILSSGNINYKLN